MIGTFRRDHRLAAAVLTLSALSLLAAFVAVAAPAQASVSRAFGIRYQNNQHGDILLRGNTLLTCPTSDSNCASAVSRSATGTALNNNSYAMVFADVDGTGNATHSSSSATVTLPSGSTVLWAGLYWSAYTASGNGITRTAPPSGTAKNRLLLKAPGDSSYRTITVGSGRDSYTDDGTATGAPYVSFAEVTDVVRAAGSGVYTAADIYAAIGNDSYGAWSLVTVIQDPAQPKRNLTVFDGFGTVQNQTGDQTIDIPLSGFETASSGAVNVQLGTVAFEGDAGSTGDQLQVIPPGAGSPATTLSDGQNPSDNYFNSTISDAGNPVAGRSPDGNAFGFDADVYTSSVLLGNGVTTATLRMNTGGETYFPAVATFAADLIAPDLTISQTATANDVNSDGRTRPGDRITYTVTVTNNGNGDAEKTVLTSPIPVGTSYVPGSLTIAGAPISDAADGDQAEVSGSDLIVRLGTGAGGSGGSGGEILQGASRTYTYTVLITGPFPSAGGSVGGSSSAVYYSPGNSRFTGASNTATTSISQASSDLQVTNEASPAVVQASGSRTVTWTATVTNLGPDTETAPVLTQALPSGVTSVSSSGGSCTGTTTLTCSLSTLASGAAATVTFTADLPSTSGPFTATATGSGAGSDPVSGNNSAAAVVAVNNPPAATGDSAALPSTTLTVDVDAATNDTDPDGDPLALDSAGPASHGTATVVNGKVRYTLTDSHYTGTDTFPYTICDDRGGCATANITVTVAAHVVSDLAVTQTGSPAVLQRDGTRRATWTVVVTNNGPDAEASPVLTQALPAGATAIGVSGTSCTAANTTATCALAPLASGDSITVTFAATLPATAPDPSAATATVTGSELDPDSSNNQAVAGVGINTAPVARPDNGKLSRSVLSVVLNVAANDTDADGDPLTVTAVTTPGHGTATIASGKILYTLTDQGFAGDDSFTYTVCDDRGGCDTATVTLAVAAHGHAPVAVNDSVRTGTGKQVSITPLANDTDADDDTLSITRIVTQPAHGSAVISGRRIVYQPADDYVGADRLSYETCDPTGLCDRAQISITVTSRAPVANTDTVAVRPGGSAVVDPLDGDARGSVKITDPPKYGRAYVDANGKIHYTAPAAGVPGGKVTIGYQTCDTTGACAESSVVLAVSGTPVTGASAGATANGSGGRLAFTGADVGRLAGLAFLLMLLGTAFITASRRHARPALSWRSYNTPERYRPTPPTR